MSETPTVAVFRPDDERMEQALETLSVLGARGLADPMLEIEQTGAKPREDGEYTVLTSKTGVELVEGTGWEPGGVLCAIGEPTAQALSDAGYDVDVVPETYSSSGLVDHLASEVDGARIEVARSDHGSPVLLDGFEDAGAYVHETILYRLVRPDGAGVSTERAADGTLDGALFSSSLTVTHFCESARERGILEETLDGLDSVTVGAIGEPTRETAESEGITVDVVPEDAEFEKLAEAVVERIE